MLRFGDPEGLGHELGRPHDEPPIAEHPEIPAEHALSASPAPAPRPPSPTAAEAARARSASRKPAAAAGRRVRSSAAPGRHDRRPPGAATRAPAACTTSPGGRTTRTTRHGASAPRGAARPTAVIDRHYFRSIYFREPSGVLFELATPSPGFTVDEPLEHLGERLSIRRSWIWRAADLEATGAGRSRTRASARR